MVKPRTILLGLALLFTVLYQAVAVPPRVFRLGQRYPNRGELDVCGNIRDVIRRNSARFLKILVRNTNYDIVFQNDDCRRMTARAKSKLDVLASRVISRWGNVRLRVTHAWTDRVTQPNLLHYEGRAVRLQTSDGDKSKLGTLAGLAAESGFDWVYYQSRDFIHASVIRDVCQTSVDLAFIVDESGSVGSYNFEIVKSFIKNIVDFFNIGRSGTHIALTTYSTDARTVFYFKSYYTKSAIKAAVDRIYYRGGWTYTASALDHVRRGVFSHSQGMRTDPGIPKVAVLLTDGLSNGERVDGPARQLRERGVNVFCIGIDNYNRAELRRIASEPVDDHIFGLNSFSDLAGWVDKLSAVSCDEGASISPCDDTVTSVESDMFKYFRIESAVLTGTAVDIELKDIRGVSHLYASLTSKNPGPVDSGSLKNESSESPRALSLTPGSSKLVYVAVQGQQNVNQFKLSIWDALFKTGSILTNIKEEGNLGQLVRVVKSEYQGQYSYSITEGNEQGKFAINPSTGAIRTTRRLDREVKSSYRLRVEAQDLQNSCHKGRTDVTVIVDDINDNKPTFAKTQYQATIREGWPRGSFVARVTATDKDTGVNAHLSYSITNGNLPKRFDINSKGEVTTAAVLDFEEKSSYRLTIMAADGGQPREFGTTVLNVGVQNVNERPSFNDPCARNGLCAMTVKENERVSTAVGSRLTATDPDTSPSCNPLRYKIKTEQSQTDVFKISNSGQISTATLLDREARDRYVVLVTVEDCNRPPLSVQTRVRIDVDDVNDNSPSFPRQQYRVSLFEGAAVGTVVTQVIARDADAGNNAKIRYTLEGSDASKFVIEASGTIKTKAIFDREVKDSYVVTVRAKDSGAKPLSGITTVFITILDVNDNAPAFGKNLYTADVPESEPVNKAVTSAVTATDKDTGVNADLVFSILNGNQKNTFSIDRGNGLVKLNRKLDFETTPFYSLTIKVTDKGSPPLMSTVKLQIKVGDVNDNAPVFNPSTYQAVVKENARVNTPVVKLSAKDLDSGNNGKMNYYIYKGDNDGTFKLDSTTGQLSVKTPPDFEKKQRYEIGVEAKDEGNPSKSAFSTIIVFVEDVNDHTPTFTKPNYQFSVSEAEAVKYLVAKVTASDADSGPRGQVVYTIESGNVGSVFSMDSNTGELRIKSPLDRESRSSYTLTLKARDGGAPPKWSTTIVQVTVTDVNDNKPIFDKNSYDFSIFEDESIKGSVGKVMATDEDEGQNGKVSYHVQNSADAKTFSLDVNSGELTLAKTVDRETRSSYVLTIIAKDQGTSPLSNIVKVKVTILDINDNAPRFPKAQYDCSVAENLASGIPVCYVTAVDLDIGLNGELVYSISDGNTDNAFRIDSKTGEIKTTKTLDREKVPEYRLKITASDQSTLRGGPTFQASTIAVICIVDENDNEPKFAQDPYEFEVSEDVAVNKEVGPAVNATDSDVGSNGKVTYSLASGNLGSSFAIDSKGVISVKSKLDREAQAQFTLTVVAKDGGNPARSTTCVAKVTVKDVNDNGPVFSKGLFSGSIQEDASPGSTVLQVVAEDKDAGENGKLTFKLEGAGTSNFSIDSKGFIYSKTKLDYEVKTSYTMKVVAEDGGVPSKSNSAQVKIEIINVNDNAPVIKDAGAAKIREDVATGTQVVRMNATDSDGNKLQFTITKGNTGGVFQIGQTTGVISVAAKLDREQVVNYTLLVQAKDSGGLSVWTNASIEVTDANDNAPVFAPQKYTAQLSENRPSERLTTVSANDKDEGSNADITFEISTGDGAKFHVDPKSGAISTKISLDREELELYTLVVSAKDNGKPSLSSTATVTITVLDENDNTPKFPTNGYAVSVLENTASGSTVLRVQASDPDEGDNGLVTYSITSGNSDGAFEVGQLSGSLSLAKILDRETVGYYKLVIKASDSASIPKSSTVTVDISVGDENDNAPIFDDQSSQFTVIENGRMGTEVGQVNCTDKDIGKNGQVTFSIVQGNDAGAFKVDSNGKITVDGTINREQIARYVLRIRATDQGSPTLSAEKDFSVNVTDVNDNAPAFASDILRGNVKENVIVGSKVTTLTATDADSGMNAKISYGFKDGNSAGKFTIDSASGVITTAASIDYEKTTSFNLTVTASDSVHITTATLIITVTDVNDNKPVFTGAPYQAAVRENSPALTSVLQVSANDADPFGQLVYSIVPGNHGDAFSIDPISGKITTANILDRETIGTYQFSVRVTDGGEPASSSVAMVTVNVSDVNDNPPVFSNNTLTVVVSEDKGAGHVVLTLSATDADIGTNGLVKYSLAPKSPSSPFLVESLTGEIKINTSLDRETVSSYVLLCQASDGGKPSLVSNEVAVRITVSDVNDNSPKFGQNSYVANVSEGIAVGSVVEELIATDDDSGSNGNVGYSISSGNEEGVFSIGNITGVVTLAKEIDRETRASYTLVIEAADHGVPAKKSSANLQINVQDVNDNAPKFELPLVGSILENEPDVTFVMHVMAADADFGKNAEFFFNFTANENTNLFSLNSRTGEIFTKKKLDRELQDKYILGISVSDKGSPQLTSFADVTINVIDVDDNCPVFLPAEYNKTITENVGFGTSILQVTASDVDIVANERIQYAIRSGNIGGTFTMNLTTGILYVGAAPVDREIADNFKIIVRAGPEYCGVNITDGDVDVEGGDDRLTTAVAVVNIQVTDENDNPPDFTQKVYGYTFSDISTTDMFKIKATDKDQGPGSIVKFKLGDQKESGGKRLVTVVAYDQGVPSLNRSVDVVITTGPKISCEAMVFAVSEDGTISTQTLCSFVKLPDTKRATLQVGDGHKMSCEANGNTNPEYRWMKDGRFVSNYDSSGDYVIESATEDDEGNYSCLASSAAGLIQSRLFLVTVNEKPRIVKQPEHSTVQLGDTVALSCEASGDPKPEYQWYKNGVPMAEASGITPNLPDLELKGAVEEDQAEYFCEAINVAGKVRSETVSLQVYGKDAMVSMELTVNKPNLAKQCHLFEKSDFQKLLGNALGAKVFLTKVSAPAMCEAHPCNSNPCLHGGQCEKAGADGYKCLCKPGWSGNDCGTDVDECLGGPCFSNGTCRNSDGSYECQCSSVTTGKDCELAVGACTPVTCKNDEVCALRENDESGSGSKCVNKDLEIVMLLPEDLGKENVKKFDLEKEIESLIRAALSSNNEKTNSSRKSRSAPEEIEYGACSVRITSVKDRKVKFVLLCPAHVQGKLEPKAMQDFVCGIMFTSGKSSSCGGNAVMNTPLPPTTYAPLEPMTVKLEFFAKEQNSGESLDADEVVSRMESEEAKEMLEKEGYTMMSVTKTNKLEEKEEKTPVALIVGMVLGLLVLFVLIIVVVVVIMRRRSKGHMNSLGRSVMSRRGSQENILQRDSCAKEISRSEKNYLNAVYDADCRDISDEESNQFMVEVNLGKKPRKAYQLPTEVLNATWYYQNLTKDEAEDTLGGKVQPGTFLVRKGNTDQELILSIRAPEGGPLFRHLVIRHLGKSTFKAQFGSLKEKEFRCVNDIIEHFKVTPIKFDEYSPDVVLTVPHRNIDVLV